MEPAKADLVLHPVRLRIIQALVGRALTTDRLAQALPDVPPATLYRHVKRLRDGGVVRVISEQRVRGAVRRTYTVAPDAGLIPPGELRDLEPDGQLRLFLAFCAALGEDFRRYLDRPAFDPPSDGVRYRQVPLYLDDAEYRDFLSQLDGVIAAAMARPEASGRRRRTFTHILIPGPLPGGEGVPAEAPR